MLYIRCPASFQVNTQCICLLCLVRSNLKCFDLVIKYLFKKNRISIHKAMIPKSDYISKHTVHIAQSKVNAIFMLYTSLRKH